MEAPVVITGKHDTYLTPAELATMVGRSEKTVRNWACDGRLQFVYLCGVPLISMKTIESMITGTAPASPASADGALRIIGRRDRMGRRTQPERHRRSPGKPESAAALLHSSPPPVGSSRP
jgi:hypothetical protein